MLAVTGPLTAVRLIKAVVTAIVLIVVVIVTRRRFPDSRENPLGEPSWKDQLARALFGAKNCPNCGMRMPASTAACPNCRFPQP